MWTAPTRLTEQLLLLTLLHFDDERLERDVVELTLPWDVVVDRSAKHSTRHQTHELQLLLVVAVRSRSHRPPPVERAAEIAATGPL